jgi:hypothetical protein
VERVPLPPVNPTGGAKAPPDAGQAGGAAAPAVTLPSPGGAGER